MKALAYLFAFLFGFSLFAAEPEGSVVQITKRDESNSVIAAKEYYLSVGKLDEVKLGDVFNVYRKIPVTDVLNGETLEFLPVVIAQIQVTNLGQSTSVARLLAMAEKETLPKMDYPVIMLGDHVKRKTGLPYQ